MTDESKRKGLFFLFFTVFLDMVGFGILIPILPELFADPTSRFFLLSPDTSLAYGYILLGFLVAIFPLGQFFATSVLGQLSDFYGRKKLLALSVGGTVFSYVLFAFGIWWTNIPLLFISRFLAGIFGGNVVVAQAAIADLSTPENRSRNFGMIAAAFGLGFIIGPYLGGKLSDPSFIHWVTPSTPFWFAAALGLFNTISILLFFKETNLNPTRGQLHWKQSLLNVKKAFTLPHLRTLYITSFLYQAGFSFYTSFFAVYLVGKFGISQGEVGEFFAFIGICVVLAQIFVVRQLARRFHETAILRWSLIGSGCAIIAFFMPHTLFILFAIVPFFSIFNGLSLVNLLALISKSADASVQGEILGINSSVAALAQAIPPAISGFVAALLLPRDPIIIAGSLAVLSGIFFTLIYRATKKADEAAPDVVIH